MNSELLRSAAEIAEANDVSFDIYDDLRSIPPYDDVRAAGLPDPVVKLIERIGKADAIVVAMPE